MGELSHLNRNQLTNLQQIFIEEKDWGEVSKIQYYIDNLPPDKNKVRLECWFQNLFYLSMVDQIVACPTEVLAKVIERVYNEKVV